MYGYGVSTPPGTCTHWKKSMVAIFQGFVSNLWSINNVFKDLVENVQNVMLTRMEGRVLRISSSWHWINIKSDVWKFLSLHILSWFVDITSKTLCFFFHFFDYRNDLVVDLMLLQNGDNENAHSHRPKIHTIFNFSIWIHVSNDLNGFPTNTQMINFLCWFLRISFDGNCRHENALPTFW